MGAVINPPDVFGNTFKQLVRYGIVGVGHNLVLYLGYLTLTSFGVGPKTSMTVFYGFGIVISFVLNRNWSFGHRGHVPTAFLRYFATYLGGYVLNLALLWWLVDRMGYPHAYVQAALVFVVAGFIFLTQKFWVFRRA